MIIRAEHIDNYTVILNETLRDERLSFEARGFLAFMLTLSDGWEFSIKGLASATNSSPKTIMRIMKELKSSGYVTQTKIKDSHGHFIGYTWTVTELPENGTSVKPNFRETELPLNRTSEEPNFRERGDIRSNNIKEITTIKKYQEEEVKRTRFVKPTLEQVTAYCQERGNNVDPVKWYDHYTSNGWKVGKNPMKDWKAAVRTWERGSFNAPNPAGDPSSKIDEALKIALQRAEGSAT